MSESEQFNNSSEKEEEMTDLQSAVETFSEYLNLKEEPEHADAIFILGGSSLAPVERAIELYKAGYAPKIAFISVGGKFGGEKVWGMPENVKYKEILVAAGIPEEAIITEGLTSNTLAEAKQAIPFIEKHGINPHSLILVSRPFHQRRAFATFSEQHPDIKYINCPGDEPLDLDDPETHERLVQEAERLLDYSAKGDIDKQAMSRDILRAAATIRRDMKEKGTYTPRVKPPRKES